MIKRILEPKEVKWYREFRRKELEKIRNEAGKENLPYPDEIRCPGNIGRLCENYIRYKANGSLPKSQFNNSYQTRDIPDPEEVEIAGTINYYRWEFSELFYSPPENSTHRIIQTPSGPVKAISQKMGLSEKESRIGGTYVFWHSHPGGFGSPSPTDVNSFRMFSDTLKGKEVYHAIFLPSINQLVWYRMEGYRTHQIA